MEFDFIVGRYSISRSKEKILAGFLTLDAAKYYVDKIDADYISRGFFYIESKEGKYVLGCDPRTDKDIWYEPQDYVYVYDCEKDRAVALEDIDGYRGFYKYN